MLAESRQPSADSQKQKGDEPRARLPLSVPTLLLELRCLAFALCLGSFDGLAQSFAGADVYFDLLRFRFGAFCQLDLQYAILIVGGDALRIERVRQRE